MSNKWDNTFKYLEKCKKTDFDTILNEIGKKGVEVLKANTPINTGRLSESWTYKIEHNADGKTIVWENLDIEGGYNVALLVQYGHGTVRGVYVKGVDYINPAMEQVFSHMLDAIWKEVLS